MNGSVDEKGRALIDVRVSHAPGADLTEVAAWVDTAFDGHLVFPLKTIRSLGLEPLAQTDAILADGHLVTLQTYLSYVEWFGELFPLQIVANEGKFPLLGTGMLAGRVLHIDYQSRTLTLD